MNEISDDQNSVVRKSTQIPADLAKFRTWADKECVNWSPKLQIEAYDVILGRKSIAEFAATLSGEQV